MLGGDNIAFVMKRSRLLTVDRFSHVFVIRHAMDKNFLGDQSYFLPLYTKRDTTDLFSRVGTTASDALISNVSSEALRRLPATKEGQPADSPQYLPPEIFGYTYAVVNSPTYRTRFLDYLKRDYARVPFARSSVLFRALARLGGELTALHLLESPIFEGEPSSRTPPC